MDPQATLEVLEGDHEGQIDPGQVLRDLPVVLGPALDFPGKALDGPGLAGLRAVDLVDIGEAARARGGNAQGVHGGLAIAQFLVAGGG